MKTLADENRSYELRWIAERSTTMGSRHVRSLVAGLALAWCALLGESVCAEDVLKLDLRYQSETAPSTGRYHVLQRSEAWKPSETAIIVCDVWDYHHSLNAVRRLEQFLPRLNQVLGTARTQGATIIHSPSDCMAAYADHPARQRAIAAPRATRPLPDAELWCSKIPAEEHATYPLDQSDGGDDDDPTEHAAWAAKLKTLGRNPNLPWQRQADGITIDGERDYLSDRGDEVWNVLEQRGIRHVILTGVHTNMCVLGRPFGLRQMVRGGRQVVLMRDLTDTMYNPARWPYVSHFTGNDLIVSHVERFVCPTITSDQIVGGKPFRFAEDKRPHLAIVIAEDPYDTARTLPEFAARRLGHDYRVSLVFGSAKDPHDIPGLSVLDEADIALISVRRRVLRPEAMGTLRRFVQAGKPIVGIRTASHAFHLRDANPPAGLEAWPEFDRQVLGGNYHGHPMGPEKAVLEVASASTSHPILDGYPRERRERKGSLYLTGPLAEGAELLLSGKHEGQPSEPVAWTYRRADGGRSFYVSLGESHDFADAAFERLLYNGLRWTAGLSGAGRWTDLPDRAPFERDWMTVSLPATADKTVGTLGDYRGPAWFRCVLRVPAGESPKLRLRFAKSIDARAAWVNGQSTDKTTNADGTTDFAIAPSSLVTGDANLIVVKLAISPAKPGFTEPPVVHGLREPLELNGRWQLRTGDDTQWSNMPLPAKFGTTTDIVFP